MTEKRESWDVLEEMNRSRSKRLQRSFVLCLLIMGVIAGWSFFDARKAQDEQARLEKELAAAQHSVKTCEARPKPACPVKETKKNFQKPVRGAAHHRARKSIAAQPKAEEKKFDPRTCGEGTEAGFNRETGKPECKALPAPVPAPVVTKVAMPKVECTAPLIHELRDDGTVACIAPPAPAPTVAQAPLAASSCLPPDTYGRIFCRRTEVKSSSSWAPWLIGGAAVLGGVALLHNHHSSSSASPPVVVSQPPVAVSRPPTFSSGAPGVNSLPPSFQR